MTILQLRRQARQRLQRLSPERLRVADDFLAYLEEREANEATEELLKIPGLVDAVRRARANAAAGRVTPATQLRQRT